MFEKQKLTMQKPEHAIATIYIVILLIAFFGLFTTVGEFIFVGCTCLSGFICFSYYVYFRRWSFFIRIKDYGANYLISGYGAWAGSL
jgi:hypothetical protein